jgi:hypothetical protein
MSEGYSPRKERIRKPLRKIVIVCEGKETEINYFEGLKTRNSGVDIIPVHGKCTDPKNIVLFAEERMDYKWSIDLDEGDCVCCVYDVDENVDSVLKDTYEHATAKKIKIVMSNPCFELWFLLHYADVFSPHSRQEIIEKLKKFVPDYEKNKTMNSLLQDKQSDAIKRAKNLNGMHQKNGKNLVSRDSNPSTQVFEIIEHISNLIQRCE